MITSRWFWAGVVLVGVGVGLLVLVARRARAERIRRARVAARRAAFAAGSSPVWPVVDRQVTSGRGGRVYGTPRQDPGETAVMPAVREVHRG